MVILFTLLAFVATRTASSETKTLNGTWKGIWRVGATQGETELILTQNGDQVAGIRKTSRLPGQEFSLTGKVSDGKFIWTSKDPNGSEMKFELSLKDDALSGYGWHANTQVYMSLKRQ